MLSEKDLNAALTQLVIAELIFQRGAPPDATYQFKHALVQDASYASLVRSRRQQLHGAIARALEDRFVDIVAIEPETLAHHFTEAGVADPAISYWLKAGQRAAARSADQEAISHLNQGLALLRTLPESADNTRRELDFQITLFTPLVTVHGYTSPEVETAAGRATALSEALGDVERLFASLHAQLSYCNLCGQTRKALEFAKRCQTLAIRQGDRVMQLMAHRAIGPVLNQLGEFGSARAELEQALPLYNAERDSSLATRFITDPFAAASSFLALILWILGYPERSVRVQKQAISHADKLNHVNTRAHTHYIAGALLEQLLGNVSAMLPHAQFVSAQAAEHGLLMWRSFGAVMEGLAICCSNHPRRGISLMKKAISDLDCQNMTYYVPYYIDLLALAHARLGDFKSALNSCIDARERVPDRRRGTTRRETPIGRRGRVF